MDSFLILGLYLPDLLAVPLKENPCPGIILKYKKSTLISHVY